MLPQKVVVFLEKEFCIRFEGITMTVSRFSKVEDETPWGIQSHAHLNFEMHYIFDGRGSITLGHTGFEIGKGEYYICPPFIDHDQETDEKNPMKEFCVECKLEVDDAGEENGSAAYGQLLNKLFYGKYSDHDGYILKCFQLMDSILTSNDGKMRIEDETILKSLLMNVAISMLFFTRNDSDSTMSRQDWNDINYHRATSIRNYLEANYKNDISVRNCTKIFFLSERQIDRILNKVFHERLLFAAYEDPGQHRHESDQDHQPAHRVHRGGGGLYRVPADASLLQEIQHRKSNCAAQTVFTL